jgi:hypothetical protein
VTERHPEHQPYRWRGVDRDGNPRSGETRMRDKTVPEMVRGFQDADYRELVIIRDGTGVVGGIDPARKAEQDKEIEL